MPCFHVSPSYVPALNKLGIAYQVIDSRHPEDGGTSIVAFCFSRQDADRICTALTFTEHL